MMIPVWFWFALIPSCVAIGFIDYLVLKRYNRCKVCGYEYEWFTWLLPTVFEVLLFLSGIAIGVMVMAK